jgi:hypothetical protein
LVHLKIDQSEVKHFEDISSYIWQNVLFKTYCWIIK